MSHELIEGSRRLRLREKPVGGLCAWSGSELEARDHAIAMVSSSSIYSTAGIVWLGVDGVEDARQTLEAFDPTDHGLPERRDAVELSPSGDVRYHQLSSRERRTCAVCGELCSRQEGVLTWYQAESNRPRPVTKVRMHPGCLDRFVDVLDRVWDHAPELLAERI